MNELVAMGVTFPAFLPTQEYAIREQGLQLVKAFS